MTTAEVAQECGGVAPKTVARWVQSGALAYVHKHPGIRGPYMFDRAAVMQFKAQREAEARSARPSPSSPSSSSPP